METEAVIRQAIDLWNQGQLEAYVACYDDHVEWRMSEGSGRGKQGIPEQLAAELTALPDCRMEVHQVIVDGERAAVEATLTGTNSGPIRTRAGASQPATGRRVLRRLVLMLRVHDGRITEFRGYSNEPAWIQQLGQD